MTINIITVLYYIILYEVIMLLKYCYKIQHNKLLLKPENDLMQCGYMLHVEQLNFLLAG